MTNDLPAGGDIEQPPAEEPPVPQLTNDLPAEEPPAEEPPAEEPPTDTDNVEPDVNNPDTWEKSINDFGQEVVKDPETGETMVPGSWLHKTLTDPAERQSYYDMRDNRRAQLGDGETTTPEPREGETTIAEPGQGDDATDVAATNRDPDGKFGTGSQGGVQFLPKDSTSVAADDLPDKDGIISYPAGFKDKDGKPKGGQFRVGTNSGYQYEPNTYTPTGTPGVVRNDTTGRFASDPNKPKEVATRDPSVPTVKPGDTTVVGSKTSGGQETLKVTGQQKDGSVLARGANGQIQKIPAKEVRGLFSDEPIDEQEFKEGMKIKTNVSIVPGAENMEPGEVVQIGTGNKQGKVQLRMYNFPSPGTRWVPMGDVYHLNPETIQPNPKNLIADSIGRPGFMSSRWGENL